MIGDDEHDACRRRRRAPGTCRRSCSPPTASAARQADRAARRTRRRRPRAACAPRRASAASPRHAARRARDQSVSFSTVDRDLQEHAQAVGPLGARRAATRRPARSGGGSGRHSCRRRVAKLLDRVRAVERGPDRACRVGRAGTARAAGGRSRARPPRPTARSADAVDLELVDLGEVRPPRRTAHASTVRRCTWRHAHPHASAAVGAGIDDALGAARRALGAVGLGVATRERARRTASASGSSAPTRGTGRARSPRRAPRRRRRAPWPVTEIGRSEPSAHAPSSPASFSSRSTTWSHVGSARARLEAGQRVERVAADAYPTRCSGSRGPSSPATPHREPERRFLVPRHRRDRRARVALRERRAGEQQHERDLAVVERVEVLGARDLEVVGARDRQVDLGRAGERR